MYCPQCKGEYRQGFTRCSDCDVELVENYVEAFRHPLARKVAVGDEYGARLWHGGDPHFYVRLLWSLGNKKVACYGVPEYAPMPESATGPQPGSSGLDEFEVWVSEENLPLAKWMLESVKEEFEKEPAEGAHLTVDEVSPETAGVCPLCFGEFTTASSHCPNCGVPLHSRQAEVAAEDSAWELCNLPKFITELRKALQAARVPFYNTNTSFGDFISWLYNRPNYQVIVLRKDFERATRVMSQVLQHWEFEPSAGFHLGRDSSLGYWPERAAQNGWFQEDIAALVWSGQNIVSLEVIGRALQEHEIPCRIETGQIGTGKVFSHPEDEIRAREIVREVVEGTPQE